MNNDRIKDLISCLKLLGWAGVIVLTAWTLMAGSIDDLSFGAPSKDYSRYGLGHAEQLMADNDCWGNDGLDHPVPTKVVMTLTSDTAAKVYRSQKMVDKALHHQMTAPDSDIYSVQGFCA